MAGLVATRTAASDTGGLLSFDFPSIHDGDFFVAWLATSVAGSPSIVQPGWPTPAAFDHPGSLYIAMFVATAAAGFTNPIIASDDHGDPYVGPIAGVVAQVRPIAGGRSEAGIAYTSAPWLGVSVQGLAYGHEVTSFSFDPDPVDPTMPWGAVCASGTDISVLVGYTERPVQPSTREQPGPIAAPLVAGGFTNTLRFYAEVPPELVRLPNESHVAEVRAGASLRPSSRVAG